MKSFEASFQQDLNGDGTVGLTTKVIEAAGSTSLVQAGENYNLSSGGSGPTLKAYGTAVDAGQFGGWTPIGVEQTATGYQVAWKLTGQDQYTVWNTDNSGNYVSNHRRGVRSSALEIVRNQLPAGPERGRCDWRFDAGMRRFRLSV